jgi:hypothetical protein
MDTWERLITYGGFNNENDKAEWTREPETKIAASVNGKSAAQLFLLFPVLVTK